MKTNGIYINENEVLAILAGRQRQICRPISTQPLAGNKFQGWIIESNTSKDVGKGLWAKGEHPAFKDEQRIKNQFGLVGDQLFGRETWGTFREEGKEFYALMKGDWKQGGFKVHYRATDSQDIPNGAWRSPVVMPIEESRIFMKITAVRPVQMKDLTTNDLIAQGFSSELDGEARKVDLIRQFCMQWHENRRAIDKDLWVWVIDFEYSNVNFDKSPLDQPLALAA